MKHLHRHLFALGATVFAVLSMLLLTTASVAAPAQHPSMTAMAGCHDDGSNKASLVCSSDCAVLCHAIVVPSVELNRNPSWTVATYSETVSRPRSVSVEADDPPPRSDLA